MLWKRSETRIFICPLDKEFCKKIYEHVLNKKLFARVDTKYARYITDMNLKVINEIPMEEDYEKFFEENDVLQFSVGSTDSKNIDEVICMLDYFRILTN